MGDKPPRANNLIHCAVTGPGEIVATDNGDATSFEAFQSPDKQACNGLCLVIIRGKPGQPGKIEVPATAEGLEAEKGSIKAGAVK
jgi:beta-galactosidase